MTQEILKCQLCSTQVNFGSICDICIYEIEHKSDSESK